MLQQDLHSEESDSSPKGTCLLQNTEVRLRNTTDADSLTFQPLI